MAIGPHVSTICPDCAKANGAIWPDCHAATFWEGTCEVCDQPKGVCDVSDWNWPAGRQPKMFSLASRD